MPVWYNFFIELCAPFVEGVLVLCVVDWIVVMFRRIFSD